MTRLKKAASLFGGRKISWAMLDQLVVSAGNFTTNIVLARLFSAENYGVFVFFFGLTMFLGTIHNAVVVYPLSVIGATANARKFNRMAGSSLILAAILTVPMFFVLLAVAWFLGKPHLVFYVFPWLVFGQLQETLRRCFFARLEFARSLPGDALSYAGQAAAIFFLAWSEKLSLEIVFLALSLTSLAAFVVQFAQLGVGFPTVRAVLINSRRFIRLGRWMFLTNTVRVIPMQAVTWVLVAFHGTAMAALVQAVFNMLNVMNPLIFSVQNLILPAAARANATSGIEEARRLVWRRTLQGALILSPYYLLLLAFPTFALEIYYGADSPYHALGFALQIYTLFHILNYITTAPKLLLSALKRSRQVFYAEIPPTVALIVVAMPLTAVFGFFGAVAGSIFEGFSRLIANLLYARRIAEIEES